MKVTVLTLVFQYVPRWPYVRFRIVWLWLLSEFFLLFPFSLVQLMNEIHEPVSETSFGVGGDFIYGVWAIWCCIHNRLGPMMVEDLVYGDMNVFQFATVPPNYLAYLFTVPAIYLAQVWVRKAQLSWHLVDLKEGGACTAGVPGLLTRQCTIQVDGFHWEVNYFNSEDLPIYNVSNIVMGIFINYSIVAALRRLNNEEAQMMA